MRLMWTQQSRSRQRIERTLEILQRCSRLEGGWGRNESPCLLHYLVRRLAQRNSQVVPSLSDGDAGDGVPVGGSTGSEGIRARIVLQTRFNDVRLRFQAMSR